MSIRDNEIRKLENELYMLRLSIIGLMPGEIVKLLRSYFSCDTKEQAVQWLTDTAQKIIDLAEAKDSKQMGDNSSRSPRTYCPLCIQGSENPHGYEGFAVPEGLMRHMLGTHNVRQCTVFAAAESISTEHLNKKFPYSP